MSSSSKSTCTELRPAAVPCEDEVPRQTAPQRAEREQGAAAGTGRLPVTARFAACLVGRVRLRRWPPAPPRSPWFDHGTSVFRHRARVCGCVRGEQCFEPVGRGEQLGRRCQPLRSPPTHEVEQLAEQPVVQDHRLGRSGKRAGESRSTPGQPGERSGTHRVETSFVLEQRGDLRDGYCGETEPSAARSDRGKKRLVVARAEHKHRARRRLLEEFEERVLGILVHALGVLHDRDAPRAFHRGERHLADQRTDGARLRCSAFADADLPARAGRRHTVQVGMAAMFDSPA